MQATLTCLVSTESWKPGDVTIHNAHKKNVCAQGSRLCASSYSFLVVPDTQASAPRPAAGHHHFYWTYQCTSCYRPVQCKAAVYLHRTIPSLTVSQLEFFEGTDKVNFFKTMSRLAFFQSYEEG